MQLVYILFFLIIQNFSLFPYEASSIKNNNSHNAPPVVIHISHPNKQPSNSCHVSVNVKAIPDHFHRCLANYSVIAHHASPQLQNYFTTVVSPLIYDAMISNHCAAIAGYTFPDGLRHCIYQLSQFSHSDAALISELTKRLETYCTYIESILFKGDTFREIISSKKQIKLMRAYADFLKEFYAGEAEYIFQKQSCNNPLMQQVKHSITWGYYDESNLESSSKQLKQHHAASLNGNLGVVYKAFHEGNSAQAYALGNERVKIFMPRLLIGEKMHITSVFERYPALGKKIEQMYRADQAQLEQECLAKQNHAQQGVRVIKAEFKEGINVAALLSRHDIVQKRYDQSVYQINEPRFFEKIHKILAEHVKHINVQHLTPDQKGILFEAGHLQHHLVDEAISVVDAVVSGDLVESMHDAVVNLANVSLTLNKSGDVVMATRTLDACWALIDCAHDAARCAYATIITHAPFVAKGIADGVCESLHGVVHAVCHPIEAAEHAAQSLAAAGYCLGKIAYAGCAYDAACDLFESDPKRYEQMIAHYSIDHDALLAVYEDTKKHVTSEDVARVSTKTVLDMMLLHGATKAVSAIAKEYWVELLSCMRKGGQSGEVALTAENLPVKCGEEIASVMQKMNDVEKSGIALEKQFFSAAEEISCVEIKNPVLDNIRTGSGLKKDTFHAFNDIIDNYAGIAKEFDLVGNDKIVRKLYQLEGCLDGIEGVFEWIVDPNPTKGVTHRLFIKGIKITGRPNAW